MLIKLKQKMYLINKFKYMCIVKVYISYRKIKNNIIIPMSLIQ